MYDIDVPNILTLPHDVTWRDRQTHQAPTSREETDRPINDRRETDDGAEVDFEVGPS